MPTGAVAPEGQPSGSTGAAPAGNTWQRQLNRQSSTGRFGIPEHSIRPWRGRCCCCRRTRHHENAPLISEETMATDVKIANSHMLVFGVPFFRANAPFIRLGSVGEAKKPVFGENFIAPEDQVPPGKLKIHKVTTLDIDASTTTSGNLSGSVSVPTLGELSADRVSQMLR